MKRLFLPILFLVLKTNFLFAQWNTLGIADSIHQYIYAMCWDKAGNLYCGGATYDSLGMFVLKYNGTQWSVLGGTNGHFTINGTISSVCSDTFGNIYMAGLSNANNHAMVQKFDGTNWNELGGFDNLDNITNNGQVSSVVTDVTGNVYAIGNIQNSTGKTYVAKYNGVSWSELGGLNSLNLVGNSQLDAICLDKAGNIYVGVSAQDTSHKAYIEKYNGTNWSVLGGINSLPIKGNISSICTDTFGNVYVAGNPVFYASLNGVLKYDGVSWTPLGGAHSIWGNSWGIHSICSDLSGNIYATGDLINSVGNEIVARCDGKFWTEMGGFNSFASFPNTRACVITDASNKVYASCFSRTYGSMNLLGVGVINPCITKYSSISVTNCQNSPYDFNGKILTTAGIYIDTIGSYLGCDSIITLNLSFNGLYATSSTINVLKCWETPYLFNNQQLYNQGIYYDTLINAVGCDSLVTLNLSTYPHNYSYLLDSFCAGDSYVFYGKILTQPGYYDDTLISQYGCDSIISLELNVIPHPLVNLSTNGSATSIICSNASLNSYQWVDCDTHQLIAGANNYFYTPNYSGRFRLVYGYGVNCYDSTVCYTFQYTGIDEKKQLPSFVKIYPNPTYADITIQNSFSKITKVEIRDLLGQLVQHLSSKEGANEIKVNVNNLCTGIYIVDIYSMNGSDYKTKLIKN